MKRIMFGLIAGAMILLAVQTGAEEVAGESAPHFDLRKLLKGDYSFVSTQVCTQSPSGFAPSPSFAPLGPTTLQNTTSQGVVTYNGDGTGSFTGRSTSITSNINATVSTPSLSSITCSLTYDVQAQGAYSAEQLCSGTTLLGVPGINFTLSPTRSTGFLRGNLLLTASDGVSVETQTIAGIVTPRICHRSTTLQKILTRLQ